MESREGRTGREFGDGAEAGTGCRCGPVFGPLLEESGFVASPYSRDASGELPAAAELSIAKVAILR